MDEYALRIKNVTKMYRLYEKPIDRLKESLSITGKNYHKEFYALRDISFDIKKGESIGIIGTNGSGKSTLLKIITGVLNQTAGEVETNGRISALLELGAGFNMEYTGLENIYLNGTIMGYSKAEVDAKLDNIIKFADIGDFIYQPVKAYSSGMFVRLAFATQIYSDPDLLIVDEALSVGDMRFQQKCYRAMEQLMKDKTVVLVTHDPAAILRFCKRAIWIEKGKLMADGDADVTLKEYKTFLLSNMEKGETFSTNNTIAKLSSEKYNLFKIDEKVERAGNGQADIIACGLFDDEGQIVEFVEPGQEYLFSMKVKLKTKITDLIAGISIKNRLGEDIFAINSYMLGVNIDTDTLENEYRFKWVMPSLNSGQYTISPAIATGTYTEHVQLCWLHDAWIFEVSKRDFQIPGIIYQGTGFEFEIVSE
jgi:ABC-type polysaccharide/polyol phosphate transport system ATPase subunit